MILSQILTPSIEKTAKPYLILLLTKWNFKRKEFEGDITMVIFPLLKVVKSNPVLGNKLETI
jgi:arginyl-tRNA synthetase